MLDTYNNLYFQTIILYTKGTVTSDTRYCYKLSYSQYVPHTSYQIPICGGETNLTQDRRPVGTDLCTQVHTSTACCCEQEVTLPIMQWVGEGHEGAFLTPHRG